MTAAPGKSSVEPALLPPSLYAIAAWRPAERHQSPAALFPDEVDMLPPHPYYGQRDDVLSRPHTPRRTAAASGVLPGEAAASSLADVLEAACWTLPSPSSGRVSAIRPAAPRAAVVDANERGPAEALAATPWAPEQAKAALDARRPAGQLPARVYEQVADALAAWGNPRSALEVVAWLYQDRGNLPNRQVCRWVFEGLLWGGHLDEAESLVAVLRQHHAPGWASMVSRLAQKLVEAGFIDRQRGLRQRLGCGPAAVHGWPPTGVSEAADGRRWPPRRPAK